MNAFARFQQAEARLAKNPSDEEASFIVDLWNASKNLHTKNTRLQAEVDSLKEEVTNVNRINADYARNADMLESKLAKNGGGSSCTPFNAKAWGEAQFSIATAASA